MKRNKGRKLVWFAFVVLLILHQDFWLWENSTLVFGFLPAGLAYHAAYSLAAVCLWWSAVMWAWPNEIEAWADEGDDTVGGGLI